ncbi:UDP-3-O-[3-hydroxymyristoyl] N-acetylglucosamine deacetylase [Candidatus Poribacteria bacterium]|nr:UDP-3-O-[3-hydroxymyristoyl] N-acetylglucosamine deacetylase [Candidatus Poribacteria bacterium]
MGNVESQQTLQSEIIISGKGLMLGEPVELKIKPAPPDSGIVFQRIDQPESSEVKVCPENWVEVLPRCTSLQHGGTTVSSVEHLLSALAGLRIDNAKVELNAQEPPGLDGSALPYVTKIQEVGLTQLDAPRRFIEVSEPFAVCDGNKQLIFFPSDTFEVTFAYDHPNTAPQFATWNMTADTYISEIASARSFCFEAEIEALQSLGIGKGASYENVVVVKTDGQTSSELRFKDEFVRHKTLDLIGDLYLAGYLPKAQVIAMRTGHTFHAQFVQALSEKGILDLADTKDGKADQTVEAKDIYRILPHRHPMCLIDRVIEFENGKRAVGIKNLTYNEPIFEGHFPAQPVMPGVLQVEALAQLGAWLLLQEIGKEDQLGYFRSISKATFRKMVIPGDQLRLEIEIVQRRSTLARIVGEIYVDGALATEAELSIALAATEND